MNHSQTSWTYFKGKLKQLRMIILCRLRIQTDLVGYKTLIKYIDKNNLGKLNGDFLEIGAFMGGGSVKLARYAQEYNEKLIVIDIFDPDFDLTVNSRNESMCWIYNKLLGGRDLYQTFKESTKNARNIIVYRKNSKKVILPMDTRLCFTFIDGNHDPKYVKSDFKLAWNKTVSGGVVAFHDYGGALTQTTATINNIIRELSKNISSIETVSKKSIIFLTKRSVNK